MSSSLFFLPGPSVGVQILGEELIKRRQQRNKGTNSEGRRKEGTEVVGQEAVKEEGRSGGEGRSVRWVKEAKFRTPCVSIFFSFPLGRGSEKENQKVYG
jgi:hypothetical protein